MDEDIQLIANSPFVKEPDDGSGIVWAFQVKDSASELLFDACISPYALLDSLGEERGSVDLMVCGCSDAGCAGLAHEQFETTERYVHWSLTEYRKPFSWYFDRAEYEKGAIGMLHDIYVTQSGWRFNAIEYDSYEQFKTAVDEFLSTKPRFKTIWDELD